MGDDNLLTVKEASQWASAYLGKNVTSSNIAYLINYGRISKASESGLVSKDELLAYYDSFSGKREVDWKEKLGDDLNWALSFEHLKEAETTKHVHRLHPYKGKFIPQLVEYFLDAHTDKFKTATYFQPGDVVLDPFCGSGTTLVEANELGIHAVGIDVSAFNALISNVKVSDVDVEMLKKEVQRITLALSNFIQCSNVHKFEEELLLELKAFNDRWFPVPEFKRKVRLHLIDGDAYGQEKAEEFLPIYLRLVEKYNIKLLQSGSTHFLEKWYTEQIRQEIDFVFEEIKRIEDRRVKKVLCIVLSRTMRSCRATTHADLATLKEPVTTTYYCSKHGKVCKPLFSILKWWKTYSKDTIKRLEAFAKIKTSTYQYCLAGDSRNIDIFQVLREKNMPLGELVKRQGIKGVFSSPPYVGLIDYHEQHAYAYDLFGFERNDDLEIGPLYKGQGQAALESYVQGISDVLNHVKSYFVDDYNVFLVANDKYDLYPRIAERSGMQIVNRYKRPVLNRTEKDKGAYAEIIFHLKNK